MKKVLNIFKNIILPLTSIFAAQWINIQIDVTQNQRYSLNSETKKALELLDKTLKVDIFLSGKLPTDYLRLKTEIQAFIKSMETHTDKLLINYIDPFEGANSSIKVISEMNQYGLIPEYILSKKNQEVEQTVVFPWAIINDGGKTLRIPLLSKNLGDNQQEKINRAIAQIEFKFFDAIFKINQVEKKKLAVLTSHDTSEKNKISSFIKSLKPYYKLASFDLKALEKNPIKTLENLKRFELLMISNPKTPFTEQEKYLLDQHLIDGGKQLWMINSTSVNRDSLFNSEGSAIATVNNLNMANLFFKYGFRLEKNLVKDLFCAPIVLASGKQSKAQYIPIPWPYYPIAQPSDHIIGNGISNLWFRFPSSIDTLKSKTKKTVLVRSSELCKSLKVPTEISLKEVSEKIVSSSFNDSNKMMGILVTGYFSSAYENRLKPFKHKNHISKGNSKMIIFSEGTLAENQLDKGNPLELGYDKWTNNYYGNKDFLKNCIHYLMNDNSLLNMRNKDVSLRMLDMEIVGQKSNEWRIALLLFPLIILFVIGFIVLRLRISKHSR